MNIMNSEERKELEAMIFAILAKATTEEYARNILETESKCKTCDTITDEIIDDVLVSSAWEDEGYYNEDDVRLAIGRTLISAMTKE